MSTDSISLIAERDEFDRAQDESCLQQEQLRMVINEMPALISYVDSEQRYQFTNKRYEEWFGRSHEELQDSHVRIERR